MSREEVHDNEENLDDVFYAPLREESDEEDEDYLDNEEDRNQNIPNNNEDFNRNQPLYRGAQITVGHSMLLILALLLYHNLNLTCIEDIIIILEMHCLQEGLKKTVFLNSKNILALRELKI